MNVQEAWQAIMAIAGAGDALDYEEGDKIRVILQELSDDSWQRGIDQAQER